MYKKQGVGAGKEALKTHPHRVWILEYESLQYRMSGIIKRIMELCSGSYFWFNLA